MKATIYVEGVIGEDTTLLSVMRQFKSFKNPSEVEVIINSYGGSVTVGQSIFNYLRSLGLPVTTIADKAYSIAASIFMAGDKRIVLEGADRIMLHLPWANIAGRAEDFERMAEALREVEEGFVEFYSQYMQSDPKAIRDLLSDDTYLSSDEALGLGLATEIQVPLKAVAYLNEEDTINNDNNKSKIMKNIEKLITALKDFTKVDEPVVALVLQDANGIEINFTDLEEGETPEVGDKAEVDNKPAEGEYVNPDGSTYVFTGGELMEIKPTEQTEDEPTTEEAPVEETVAEVVEEQEEEVDFQAMLDNFATKIKADVRAELEDKMESLIKTNEGLNEEVVALKKLIGSDDLEVEKNERFESKLPKGMQRASEILNARKR